jgi:hypothetical protein
MYRDRSRRQPGFSRCPSDSRLLPWMFNAVAARRDLQCFSDDPCYDGSLASSSPHLKHQLCGPFSRKAGFLAFGDVTIRFDHNHVATFA